MKIAPLLPALERVGFRNVLVHTGQHYDENMSGNFFEQLDIREPDYYLGVGSGSHTEQTAAVMTAVEPVLEDVRPALVMVVGDVNSTLAAALAAAQRNLPVAHVEAGLRSGDWSMPEEKNRVLTDRLSELLFTPSPDADENLQAEGIPGERIHRVGNIMIDSLMAVISEAEKLNVAGRFGFDGRQYAVATVHRPSNVDDARQLRGIVRGLDRVAEEMPVLLPLHPRTGDRLERLGLAFEHVRTTEPVGYLEMLALMQGAAVVLTDSGGIQEETTILGVPCLTLRASTERPITITEGTNRLVAERTASGIWEAVESVLTKPPSARRPEIWDGHTAERIADVLTRWHDAV
jgi:UDP-N-acetylglucosamine 2-epimerase (non-hydrolysing)